MPKRWISSASSAPRPRSGQGSEPLTTPSGAAALPPRLLPPAATERHVATSRGRLRVLHAGAPNGAVPLLLIHGGGSDNAAISWYRLMAPLSADREVWAPDLPGFGMSLDVEPAGGPAAMADMVAEVMDRLGIARAVAFGVSMGGDVAMNLALHHPERVAGLGLIAPGGLSAGFERPTTQYLAWLTAQAPDWLLLPLGRLANLFVRSALRAMVKDPATLPPAVVDEFVREAQQKRGAIGYIRYNQATLGRHGMLNDLSDRVREITVPTLLFHGEDDPLVDPAGSRRAAARLPNARLVMVPDCGHWAQLEAHDRFLREAQAFLASL